jgi:hypothetical protein
MRPTIEWIEMQTLANLAAKGSDASVSSAFAMLSVMKVDGD